MISIGEKNVPQLSPPMQVRKNPATPPLEVGSPVAPDDGAYYGGELGPRLTGGGVGDPTVSVRLPICVMLAFLLTIVL